MLYLGNESIGSSLFLDLLADKSPKEVLSRIVFLVMGNGNKVVNEF